jgi:uncharacterized protein YggE
MKRLVLLACLSLPLPLFAEGGLPDKPYLYVEGNAAIQKPADMVTLRFDLVGRNPDQAKANQEVQAKASKTLALLSDKKIGQNDIVAEDIQSQPQFESDDSGRKKGKIIGYSVTRRFNVKVRDLAAFPKLVNELIGIPGTEFTEIAGGLTNEKEMNEEIRLKALGNAREQAEKIAKGMNVTIDSVFAISSKPFPQILSTMFSSEYDEVSRGRVVVTGEPEYLLGPMTVSQSVHVIYLISPAK